MDAQSTATRLSAATIAAIQAASRVSGAHAAGAATIVATATAAATAARTKATNTQATFEKKRKGARGLGLALCGVAPLFMLAFAAYAETFLHQALFLLETALMLLALAGVGLACSGRVFGAAIDDRNRVSLSKLQMLMWTTLTLASLLTMVTYWLHDGGSIAPLDPGAAALAAAKAAASKAAGARGAAPTFTPPPVIPPELLVAMGISAASFVATPMLLSIKSNETPAPAAVDKLETARGTDLQNVGKVDARGDPAEASFADLFRGDEVGSALSIDVSKVQQIAITMLLLGLYGGAVFKALALDAQTPMLGLPPLDKDFVTLLAISHAGYLGYKAAPKTNTGATTGS